MPNYGSYEKFPYTNFHGLNLDWLLEKMKELETKFDEELWNTVKEEVSKLVLSETYDPATETLTLVLEIPDEEE